ncbi:non-ribosomal peptide synthetase [Streptomyces sp. WMMC500]|uniref:non-ribosomal peptide synthetase n=1 Tax=Streptomyces sp. WMMC500 TaxID=3015154 RepID=UPI00248C00B6|nr:non-ribosomal peptide synthetase [Streptomyces sp. WMMC500]WBB62061.1 non-ribosomal peptide synthetase [Streptomyces sp. WMMC500]
MPHTISESYLAQFRAVTENSSEPADLFPLTGAQRRFVLARSHGPRASPDIVPLFFTFPRGTVELPRLRRAAVHLAARHTVLRGHLVVVRGTPVLRAGRPLVEVREVPLPAGRTAAQTLREELRVWRSNGPALRLLVARGGHEEDELLAIVLDHVACDEQALGTVTAGLTEAYAADPGSPPRRAAAADATAYREAVIRQLAAEERASRPAALAYWAKRLRGLSGAPAGTLLPNETGNPDRGMLSHRLPSVPPRARGTLFPTLLDAFSAVLRRPRAVPALGYPWGGRPAGTPPVLGCFLNTVVHPVTGRDTLAELTARWWDDLDHADTPYDEVVRAARRTGTPWSGALAGLLTFEELGRRPPLRLGGRTGRETYLAVPRRFAAPLAVSASHGEDLLLRLVWNRAHLPDGDAETAFQTLLDGLRCHLAAATAPVDRAC